MNEALYVEALLRLASNRLHGPFHRLTLTSLAVAATRFR